MMLCDELNIHFLELALAQVHFRLLGQISCVIFLDLLHDALRRAEHPLPRIGSGAGAL